MPDVRPPVPVNPHLQRLTDPPRFSVSAQRRGRKGLTGDGYEESRGGRGGFDRPAPSHVPPRATAPPAPPSAERPKLSLAPRGTSGAVGESGGDTAKVNPFGGATANDAAKVCALVLTASSHVCVACPLLSCPLWLCLPRLPPTVHSTTRSKRRKRRRMRRGRARPALRRRRRRTRRRRRMRVSSTRRGRASRVRAGRAGSVQSLRRRLAHIHLQATVRRCHRPGSLGMLRPALGEAPGGASVGSGWGGAGAGVAAAARSARKAAPARWQRVRQPHRPRRRRSRRWCSHRLRAARRRCSTPLRLCLWTTRGALGVAPMAPCSGPGALRVYVDNSQCW